MKSVLSLTVLLIGLMISVASAAVPKVMGGKVATPEASSCIATANAYDTFQGSAANLVDHTSDTGQSYSNTYFADSFQIDGSGNAIDDPISGPTDLTEMDFTFSGTVNTVQIDVTMTAGNTIVPGPAYSFRTSGDSVYSFFDGSSWMLCYSVAFLLDCSSLLGSSTSSPPSVGTTQTLKIVATPSLSSITFSVDDVVIITGSYSFGGKPGIAMVGQTGPGGNLMNNFCATDE